jgi:O-antigen ligase
MQLLTDAHNFVLNVAAQAGLVGIIPLILICIAVVRYPLASIRSSGITAPLNVALWIAFISAFLVQGLVGSFEDARHLWVLIGLIVAVQTVEASPSLQQGD